MSYLILRGGYDLHVLIHLMILKLVITNLCDHVCSFYIYFDHVRLEILGLMALMDFWVGHFR